MLSKFAHHVRRKRRDAARIFGVGDPQYSEPGSVRSSLEQAAAYGPIKCSVTDPEDGTSLHWDQGSLTRRQLDKFVPQCDQLCVKCLQLADDLAQDLNQSELRTGDRYSYSHHDSLGTLRSSAIAGCHFCTLICSGGSNAQLNDRSDSRAYLFEVEIEHYYSDIYYRNTCIATDDGEYIAGPRLNSGWFPRDGVPMTQRFPSTGCPKVLDLARRWLEGCMTTHSQCCLPTVPAHPVWSPTRLLQISASDGSISNIRLVPNPNLLGSKGYLTLSHRWGGADVVKLTKDTLDPFLMDIPLERLPRNFFDAVLVTIHLGFKFLWIDSLCIIQDSETDWQQESMNMGKVYRHAQCTIAAVGAQDSHGGLFKERNELELACCQLLGSRQGGYRPLWAQKIDQWGPKPLYERAWVMQEQCLSRRILEFEATSISWQCIAGSASEIRPSLQNRELDMTVFYHLNRQVERMLTILDDQELSGNYDSLPHSLLHFFSGHWIQTWWQVIEMYTFRELTYMTDRMAAISGLINLISEARGVPVTYGIWVPYLVSDLLWRAWDPAEGRVTNDFPSWSWLSVSVGITHMTFDVYGSAILDHGAATVSIDQTASLQRTGVPNKILKITAHMLEVRQSGPLYKGTHIGARYVFQLRDGRNRRQGWERLKDLEEDWDGEWYPDTTYDAEWNVEAIQFLETVHRNSIDKESPWYGQSTGLMVVPVDEEARVYSRVGWYSIEWEIEKNKKSFPKTPGFQYIGPIADSISQMRHRDKILSKRAKPWKKHWKRWLGEKQTIWLV